MTMRRNYFLLLFFSLFFSSLALNDSWDPEKIPNPRSTHGKWVSDPDSILKRDTKNYLNDILDGLEVSSGYEMGIAIVNRMSSSSHDIESFTKAVFDHWGVGKKGINNGVLFFLSVQDRKMRLQTGAGSKSVLTDERCKSIIDSIVGSLREGDYDAALLKVANDVNYYLTSKWIAFYDFVEWLVTRILVLIVVCTFIYAFYKTYQESQRRKQFEARLERLRAAEQILPRVSDGEACGICLEELKSQRMLKMAACNHIFHEACIVEWLEKKNTCPFCRQPDPLTPKSEQPHQPDGATEQSRPGSSYSCAPTAAHNNVYVDNVLDANMFLFRDVSSSYTYSRVGGFHWNRVVTPSSSRSSSSSRSFGGGHSSGGGGASGSW